ncbi:MAG TPA: insulinase family protein, partial [Novosphingobium sp.]|nr:insulinase family protein [Novosphingobium sp.]
MRLKSGLVALMGAALVLGAAPDRAGLLAAPPSRLQQAQKAQTPVWGIEGSDLPRDPAFRLGRLANGMRYIIRHNETPKGQVVIRLRFDVGSLDEGDDQRGYAHFVEHMAFEGSTHVPAGEMVRLLERNGLAFGADTNAFTSFETTTYHLDLPRNDAALVETALMLMRETAGELTFDPAAVDRERGVIQAEKRDRDNWSYRETVDRMGFLLPQSRVMQRWPIGTPESLNGATAQGLRAFWAAHYVPSRATLVVVGDIDPVRIEADIARRFGNWPARPAPAHPPAGPFPPDEAPRSAIYTDPALTERVLIARTAPHDDEPDTLANRREELLRAVGYGIINRRLQHLARAENPPLRSASFGTGESFHAVRTTQLAIDALSGQMPRAIQAGVETWRRAMEQGFTPAEVNEQLVNLCAGSATAAVAANTRSNLALAAQALSLVTDQVVPVDPVRMNDWVQAEAATVTPEAVLAALRREALPLDRPLIRFQGRAAPAGGVDTLRAQFAEAMAAPLPALAQEAPQVFAYGNFGAPGRVVADRRDPLLGVRMVRFANGVMLNLKHTDLMKGQALVQMNVDGGGMLATRAAPLAVELVPMMGDAGLGRHSRDDLQTILAGHPVALGLVNRPETFQSTGAVRSEDVRLQLQVMAAYLTDPGYRLEAEREYRSSINTLFARLQAAPEGV